jgi:polyisoprenyl-phosphate glycosyltransferase
VIIHGSVTDGRRRELRLLSVVGPLYNEEETLSEFYQRVCAALQEVPFELILVDDGSTDSTAAVVGELARQDPRVKGVLLSRNFGHQAALTAGLDHASGDAAVMIDADLQDPPELILEMIERWEAGSDVVYAVRADRRGEGTLRLKTKRTFYQLFGRLSELHVFSDSGDFRLLDRRALDVLAIMREHNRYLRGMTIWIGFTQTAISYTREERFAGTGKYTLPMLVRLAWDGLSSFSYVPLRLATWLGFTFSILAFLGIPVIVGLRATGTYYPGFASTTIVILLLSGIQLIAIGVIGEYIGRIYDEVRGRPIYIVRGRVNVVGGAELSERRTSGAALEHR